MVSIKGGIGTSGLEVQLYSNDKDVRDKQSVSKQRD